MQTPTHRERFEGLAAAANGALLALPPLQRGVAQAIVDEAIAFVDELLARIERLEAASGAGHRQH